MPVPYQVRGKLRQETIPVIPAKAGIHGFLPLFGTRMTICIFMRYNLLKITSSATAPINGAVDHLLMYDL